MQLTSLLDFLVPGIQYTCVESLISKSFINYDTYSCGLDRPVGIEKVAEGNGFYLLWIHLSLKWN